MRGLIGRMHSSESREKQRVSYLGNFVLHEIQSRCTIMTLGRMLSFKEELGFQFTYDLTAWLVLEWLFSFSNAELMEV